MAQQNNAEHRSADGSSDDKDQNAATKQRLRKTHRKSRRGCGNCKRRRVKCDEAKPACKKCTTFTIHCDYLPDTPHPEAAAKSTGDASQPRRRGRPRTNRHLLDRETNDSTQTTESTPYSSSSTGVSAGHVGPTPHGSPPTGLPPVTSLLESPTQTFVQQLPDMKLIHHYLTVTSATLSDDEPIARFWREGAVELAFEHPFVLRLLLAFAAFHMARFSECSSERSRAIEREGETHATAALEDVRAIVPNIDGSNCQPLYIAAQMIALGHLGAGPKLGEYLAFGNEGATTWLHLLRGVRSIRAIANDNLFIGKLAPLGPRQEQGIKQATPRAASREYEYSYEKPLSRLRKRVESNPHHQPFQLAELDSLEDCFFMQCEEANDIIFAWLYRASDDYVAGIHAKDQVALAIFAHFAVLMKAIEHRWYVKGWPRHIMEGILGELDAEHVEWIQWPLAEVGLIRNDFVGR